MTTVRVKETVRLSGDRTCHHMSNNSYLNEKQNADMINITIASPCLSIMTHALVIEIVSAS